MKASVVKTMGTNPRRISDLTIAFDFCENNWTDSQAEKAIRAGKACPVAKTIGEDVKVHFSFKH
jgi:uncharacterized OsmC-like protein